MGNDVMEAIEDTFPIFSTRQKFICQEWKDFDITAGSITLKLGQLCTNMVPDSSQPTSRSLFGFGRLFDEMHSRYEMREGRQSLSLEGETFENAKAVCEEDFAGSFLDIGELFDPTICSSLLGGFNDIFGSNFTYTIDDSGNIQNSIANLLGEGQSFYINAKSEIVNYLFRYGNSDLYHYSPQHNGKCLVIK